jgi:hypothetical protein
MANQIIIDIGAVANDGTGDPLRTAFGYVNNNFSNIWASGVANSNIQFDGNRILTTNTNGNLVLSPNGIGKVQSNVDIVPNANNALSLGSLTRQWNTVYAQNLAVGGNVEFNDLTVDGNLTVTGNIIQIGNIVTDSKTIQLANTAGTAGAANGSGITVGANDNIATMLYSSTSNTWVMNVGANITGNVTAPYFIGNGSLLTGISSYGNANVAAYLASGTNTSNIVTTNTVSANNINFTNNLYGKTGTFTGDATGDNSIYAGYPLFTSLGSDVVAQFSGNVDAYTQFNFQNGNTGTQASGDYVITADNGNDTTHFINLGITGSGWNGTQTNSLGNRLGPNDGYLYVQDGDMVIGTSNGNIETWKFGQDGTLTVAGDIVPTANNTQNLGSATNQWNDLYISNATIFMNGVPITLGAGNVLTVGGQPVLTNDSTTSISTTGNITADYFIGDGSQLTNLPGGGLPIANGTSNFNIATANGNATVTAADTYTWTFDNTGNLTIPGSIVGTDTILIDNRASGNTADIQLFSADDILLQARDRTAGSGSEGGDINIYAGDSAEDSDSSGGDIQILAGNGGAGNVDFASTGGFITIRSGQGGAAIGNSGASAAGGGSLTLQAGSAGDNNGNIDLGANGGDVVITAGLSTGNLNPGGDVQITSGQGGANASAGQIELNVPISDAGPGGTWSFNYTGDLNLPTNGNINFNGGSIAQALNEDFYIRASDDEDDGWSIYNVIDDGAGNILSQTRLEFDQYTIRTDAQGASYTWAFRDTGVLELPGDIYGNVGGNLTVKIGDSAGSDTFIDLQTRSYVGDALISNIRIANPNVTVSTASGVYNWNFDNTGNLNLPLSGNLVGQTANNNGHITWLGNSSGDGLGYTTMQLVPDDTTGDAYLIIDPTAPNHIHIRAGGAQDNSGAQLYLGGENSYFLVENGANSNVYVASNSNQWKFDTTGVLTLPGEGVLQSLNDTVTLASLNTTTGNVNSVYLGSSGGLGFFDQEIGGNWLEIFRSGSDPEIRVPPGGGNILITGASGSGGASGRDITITAGPADQTNYYTTAGGAVNLVGGLGATDDGGGGGPGGNVNLTAGVSADPAGHAGNVNITAGSNSWVFDYSGNVTIPGNINGVLSSPAPSLNGFGSVNSANVNATGNISGGNLTVGSGTITGGNVNGAIFNGNVAFGNGTVGGSGNITGGNISAIGNITGGNILGNGASMTGVVTKTTGTWNVTTGTNTYSFTVPANGVYQLWVNGNIPNGIIVYNATVSVSNTNVPVIGQQFAWNYEGAGNPIAFTSIPAQIIGTAGAISNASPSVGTTTNTFDFGINNSSGNTVTVNYGYTKIS